jgi:uncharacterized protein (TIGR02453 family)
MISKSTFDFLKSLKKNNNREWFNRNKPRYEQAKNEFEDFINSLIPLIANFDETVSGLEAKNCIFRIYKDVRFSKDRIPYNTYLGAHIVKGGRKSEHNRAGYYVHIEPGNSMLGGGAYLPPADWLKTIRKKIADNTNAFKKIIKSNQFRKYFGEIEGEKLKIAPKDYPKDHPEIELLKYKSYLSVYRPPDKDILSNKFLKHASEVFKAYYPFCSFLNQQL